MEFKRLTLEQMMILTVADFERDGIIIKPTEKEIEMLRIEFALDSTKDLIPLRNSVVKHLQDLKRLAKQLKDDEGLERFNATQTVLLDLIDRKMAS